MTRKLSSKYETLHYYRDKKENEVDFVVLEDGKASALYQVCFDLTDKETRDREVRSLVKAGAELDCLSLYLVYMEKPATLEIPAEIQAIPIMQFLS